MSTDYWRMKLGGVIVRLQKDGAYYKIESVSRAGDSRKSAETPEETLPYMRFELNSGNIVTFDDFEIHFPPDQGIKHRGKVIMGYRHMVRQYKLGPASDNFKLTSSMRLDTFFNILQRQKYDHPSEILTFPYNNDLLFTENLWLKVVNQYVGYLFYGADNKLVRIERHPDEIIVKSPRFPEAIIKKVFGNHLKLGSIKAPHINIKTEPRDYQFLLWSLTGEDSILPDTMLDVYMVGKDAGDKREKELRPPNGVGIGMILNTAGSPKGFRLLFGEEITNIMGNSYLEITSRDSVDYYSSSLMPDTNTMIADVGRIIQSVGRHFYSIAMTKRRSVLNANR